jgi:hypothetical protein
MKNALFTAVLPAAAVVCLSARPEDDSLDPGVFAKWLASDSSAWSRISARFPA